MKRLRLPYNELRDGAVAIASALCQMSSLTELNLRNNYLSEAVIDELSSVTKSNKLLHTLNLSGNNFKTNAIIRIAQPLSVITNLTALIIQSNRITEGAADAIAVAILSNPKLEELYLGNNNLASGIIKIASALQYLTKLKILDINHNNAPEEAAKELAVAIYNNRLELENLWLANNNFRSSICLIADSLTKTNTLKDINLSGNSIPEEAAVHIAAVIDSNHSLQDVRLSNNLLMTNGMIKIAQSLSRLSTLKVLDIDDNKIDDRAAEALATVIINNRKLSDLFLTDNLFQIGAITIAKALRYISTLTTLGFSSNSLPGDVAEELASAIVCNSTISSVGIMNNNFEESGMTTIMETMSRLKHITCLNVYNNHFTERAAELLSSLIVHNRELQELYVGKTNVHNNIADLISSIKSASKLKRLNMDNILLSKKLVDDLGIALTDKPIERLDLENCCLRDTGIMVLAKSMLQISTLKVLKFYNNHITDEGADGIASIITSNSALADLYLGRNKLKEGALKVAKALKHLSTLRSLDLNDNSIPMVVADELAAAILCNRGLEQLWLRCNMFKTKGVQIIAKSLNCLSTLKGLNFRDNEITEAAVDDIVSILLSNQEIQHIYLGGNLLHSGIPKIITAMKNCPLLKTLDFDYIRVPESMSTEIASVICNSILEILYLQRNPQVFGIVIAQALNQISTLTFIDFNDNNITGVVSDLHSHKIVHWKIYDFEIIVLNQVR